MMSSILTIAVKVMKRIVQKIMANHVKKIKVLRTRNWMVHQLKLLKGKKLFIITLSQQLFFVVIPFLFM
jgi:hypothetical protein